MKSGGFPWPFGPQADLWWPCKEKPTQPLEDSMVPTNTHRCALDTKIDMNLMMSLYDIKHM